MIKNIISRHQLTIKARFILILGTLVIGFSLFGLATFKAMTTLNVNGPVYQHIVQGKDIIADVLPPPEFIIESYMVALQLTVAEDFYDMKTQAFPSFPRAAWECRQGALRRESRATRLLIRDAARPALHSHVARGNET